MIYSPKTIEEHILSQLQAGALGTVQLLAKIVEVRSGTTKQAFYQALRKLKEEEVVIVRSKRVSLSHLWIKKMSEYFERVQYSYLDIKQNGEEYLNIEDGERISYTFKTYNHADIFWGHAFGVLSKTINLNKPICIYNPHEWFMIARRDSEKALFDDITKGGRNLFVLVGNSDPLDQLIKLEFDGKFAQYHTLKNGLFQKENYYLNIFGEYLIEAQLDENISKDVDAIYKKNTGGKISDETINELRLLISKKGKNKITISKNKRKSDKLRAIFKKYFFETKQNS